VGGLDCRPPLFAGSVMSGVAADVPDPVRGEDCQTVAALITPQQCRMARAALRLTQARLASLADLSVVTLREFENGRARLHVNHRQALAAILSAAGVQFDADAGKLWVKEKPRRGENFRFG
jgi:DNA-binding transcriptional regulator YiaG